MPGLLFLAVGAAVYIAYARPTSHSPQPQESSPQSTISSLDAAVPGNLSVQPEAVKLSRRVRGNNFDSKKPRTIVISGVLTTGTEQRRVQIRRYQTDAGEQVEVSLAGANASVSWDAASGAHSAAGPLDVNERLLLERFTFDSADQFILAQLRGASYCVVARNVRPDDAPETYSGPIWDVVRIDDPEPDLQKQPLSRWRLYYLNTTTGLIDKITYDSQGDRVEARLSDWTDRDGEEFPVTITWTSHGQPLATFNLTNVSLVAQ